ncbi:MAG: preprotein translocase subunit SecY [Patescibacteria group bacterium]
MWYQKVIQLFKAPDLRNKVLFVLGVFVIFRLMANIAMPGINAENLKNFYGQFEIFGLMSVFTGGTTDRISVLMLGLGPYITSVIILQLLTMIFPQLEKLYKEEGESGRQKFNQYGRLLTVPLSLLQGYSMIVLFQRQQVIGALSPLVLSSSLLVITGGTVFLMWLGELISEKGIGNGVSLLIFAGIVSEFPANVRQLIMSWDPSKLFAILLFFGLSIIIIASVVFINQARRNIPVSYAKRVRGTKMFGGASTYLPLSVNPAGVIPIIFAMSILLFPGMVANFFASSKGIVGSVASWAARFFSPQTNPFGYNSFYFILVALFTFFYTAVTFDPKTIAANLQKMGGFVPGMRPGEQTAKFLYYILYRILPVGALFLGLIAVAPSIVQSVTRVQAFGFLVGGTSLLIVVSVVLETMQQIKAQLEMREYESF